MSAFSLKSVLYTDIIFILLSEWFLNVFCNRGEDTRRWQLFPVWNNPVPSKWRNNLVQHIYLITKKKSKSVLSVMSLFLITESHIKRCNSDKNLFKMWQLLLMSQKYGRGKNDWTMVHLMGHSGKWKIRPIISVPKCLMVCVAVHL